MLLQNIRAKIGARLNGDKEAGFTLIELLVVMLILGILAAIALPAFFNQKEKAGDAKAKETAHGAQVAMETYATDNGGKYTGATVAKLHAIEPTVPAGPPLAISVPEAGTGYELTVTASSGTTFTIKNEAGNMTYPCSAGGKGGCPDDATEGGPGDWSK
ncbi:MAG TPA: prepilin-type N-terminal cleavage/methylation domain-containing protein [Solirubrobacterales bacterium]|nr:prepilin-type N-terminal cleavage/methylation domain-containing protein [Solirubrobacterales bacterium]